MEQAEKDLNMCKHIIQIDNMVNITLSVPEMLYKKMRKHPEFKWSEVARQAIAQRLKDEELLRDLKAIAKAEKEHKEGKTISHKQLMKELGF